jgi:hypothetical protein
MKPEWMVKADRAKSAGVSLGINWDVLSDMLAARHVSCEVPLSAFEFFHQSHGHPRRFVIHGAMEVADG